ncbi:MAG: hypothetical protein WBL93_10515 [Lutisporaceae bacterium]
MEISEKTLQQYPEIMTALQISEYLSIGYVKALHLIKYSGMHYIKIGNTFRVNKKKFELWLNQDGQIHIL